MASRTTKITLGIVGGVVGLALIAVLALVLWGVFRPPLVGDYEVSQGELETITNLNANPLEGMVASVGDVEAAANTDPVQLDNRISNTLGQVGVLRESSDALTERGAAKRDAEFGKLAERLDDAYESLEDQLGEWQDEGYADVMAAAQLCAADPSGAECRSARGTLEGESPENAELAAIVEALPGAGSDPERLSSALSDFRDAVTESWQQVTDATAEAQSYLDAQLG